MKRIAEWNLQGSKNGAPLTSVCVALHEPEPDPRSPHGDCRTLVEFDGVAKSRHIVGVNSMQSLVLALRFLYVQVESAINSGWVFYFDESDNTPFDLLESLTPTVQGSTDES